MGCARRRTDGRDLAQREGLYASPIGSVFPPSATSASGDVASGSRTVKQLPAPASVSTSTYPPISSVAFWVTASPTPLPS